MAKAKHKETEFDKLAVQMERGFASVAADFEDIRGQLTGTSEKLEELRQEMMDQFDHVDTQNKEMKSSIRDIYSEIVNIHRQLERLDEQGASSAGFAKEIDMLLVRMSLIEKKLGIKHTVAKQAR